MVVLLSYQGIFFLTSRSLTSIVTLQVILLKLREILEYNEFLGYNYYDTIYSVTLGEVCHGQRKRVAKNKK